MSKFTTTAQDGITSITNGKTTRTIATDLAKQLRSRKGVSMNEANQLIWDMAKNGIMPAEAKESTLQDDLVSALRIKLNSSNPYSLIQMLKDCVNDMQGLPKDITATVIANRTATDKQLFHIAGELARFGVTFSEVVNG